jgi:hypothetical protein
VKHPKLVYGFIAVIGIVILALILASLYLFSMDAVSILEPLYPICHSGFGLWLVIGGIVFLTVGIIGLERYHFKNHRNLLTVLVAISVPLLTFATVFSASVLMIVYGPMFPLRSEITQVTVVDTNPLVLSVNVRAITCRDSRIAGAIILNEYDQLVAESYPERRWIDYGNFHGMGWAVLPAHSEIALTLDFNATLPSGNYTVRLSEWEENHGSASFTISLTNC